eukprot:TRINITY_DN776_c0_g5_i1.p1 TRINITY_DN776_c0_g5~~TRINITY_DN776_c0_g5_i1.p1  ORF type:complete len:575 (+),score=204.51 TRINITY_DN776_c0_g5_i1:93-1817(+)
MRSCALAVLLAAPAAADMYDATFPTMLAPASCKSGCANWADLAADGNTRSQSDVDKKWNAGKGPSARVCAMPAKDPDRTYWCYCKDSHDSSWGHCASPVTPVVEQINLQYVKETLVVASFVTFGEAAGAAAPTASLSTSPSFDGAVNASGVTHVYDAPYKNVKGEDKKYNFHFVKLSGLKPGGTYYYKVKSAGSEWSEVHSFKALKAEGPTKLAIFGDMGVYNYNNMGNLQRDAIAGDIDTIVHLGDHAYNFADSDGTRGDGYVNAFSKLIANFTWVPVLGNHEFYGDIYAADRYVNMTYGEVYGHEGQSGATQVHNAAAPVNALIGIGSALGAGMHGGGRVGTPSRTSRFYSVDVGLVHFVSLDLNVYYFSQEAAWRQPQLDWLKADLEAAAKNRDAVPWIVCGSHYPMYCTSDSLANGKHQDGQGETEEDSWSQDCWSYGGKIQEVRGDLEPLYAKYGVDLYFAGHEHNYESMWPVLDSGLAGPKTFVEPQGPVHFTTGAGGAPALDTFGPTADFIRKRLSAWGYGRLTAHNASHITYDHVLNTNGTVYDSVTVVKSKHGPYNPPATNWQRR